MRTFVKILEVLEIIASAVVLAGVFTFFHACGKHDDVYQSCHWAQVMIQWIAVLLIVQAFISLIAPVGRVKAGISIAMIPTACLISAIPGTLIPLCLSKTMDCWVKMRPFSIIGGLVIAGLALIHTLFAIISSSHPPKKNNGEDIRMSSRDKNRPPEPPYTDEYSYVDPEGIE